MLRTIREGQRWLTAVFVIALGGVFVFFLVPGMQGQGGPSAGSVIEVGPYRFGVSQFEAERSRRVAQYEEALGDQFDASALADTLNEVTAQALVERAILAMEAKKLGIEVSKGEVERLVVASSSFRGDDGRFSREAFQNFIEYEFGTERAFMIEQRIGMLAAKMARVLNAAVRVSEGEARTSLSQRLEEIRIAFVALDASVSSEEVDVSAEEVAAVLAEREEAVRDLYHQRSERYDVPEQVRARHILVALDAGADDAAVAAARARAAEVAARIQDGEDFEIVAAEVSDDPGSKTKGGDLGFFRRGQMVKPVEEAAFSLDVGVLSEPVRSDFGFHVLRVEEHSQAKFTPFEEVREVLAREVAAVDAGQAANRAVADELSAAIAGGRSLEEAARGRELTLERSGWLRRRPDGFVPGLGAAQDLMSAAFTMEPGESSAEVFQIGGKLALVQVLERQMPGDVDIEQGIDAERERLKAQKRNLIAQGWIEGRRRALFASGDLAVDLSRVAR